MKKLVLAALTLFLPVCMAGAAGTSFSAGLGFDFFNYRPGEIYLSTSLALAQRIGEDLDLDLGVEFGLTTEPQFFIPATVGLSFHFPAMERLSFLIGLGLTPLFLWEKGPDSSTTFRFYLGPYLKSGIRFRTHRFMSIFLELQQDLLIGAPDWINTSTRIHGGVTFSIP